MRTRCPACSTVFRVTSEQMRLKAGKVRCGHCQSVFNAFDQLVDETLEAPKPAELAPSSPIAEPEPELDKAPTVVVAAPEVSVAEPSGGAAVPAMLETADTGPETLAPELTALEIASLDDAEMLPDLDVAADENPEFPEAHQETLEESTLAAREAGLVAMRELNDPASYNRWAAGTLAGAGLAGFDAESAKPAAWPFALVSALLGLVLLGQLLVHFRTEVVQRLPDAARLYQALAIDVPLPTNAESVAIESSDLQSDNQRGMFVLQATLRNRAVYAQAWPDLELTLTDTHDAVVARRVLAPGDYLPPGAPPEAFPANGEIAVRLWIEAKDIGAAGYRLYVFYP